MFVIKDALISFTCCIPIYFCYDDEDNVYKIRNKYTVIRVWLRKIISLKMTTEICDSVTLGTRPIYILI